MSFNKNTWSKDYTGAKGIKLLGAEDALRKGFRPKASRKGSWVANGTENKKGKGAFLRG